MIYGEAQRFFAQNTVDKFREIILWEALKEYKNTVRYYLIPFGILLDI